MQINAVFNIFTRAKKIFLRRKNYYKDAVVGSYRVDKKINIINLELCSLVII